jgi:sugar lactone lactonase YvrE
VTSSRAERVRPGHRDRVGESPLWDAARQALWWVDIEACAIRRLAADATLQSWTLPERVACLALHAEGGLVAALETRIVHAVLADDGSATLSTLAAARHERADMRFNDGRCDRAGRFWVGSMVRDMGANIAAGRLYRLAPQGFSAAHVDPLYTPNGLAFDPDGRGIWWSDSHPLSQCIWHAPLADDGTLGPRRLVVDMHDHPGRPDGAAVDVDGGYWICANDGGRVLRFTPDGRIDREFVLPVSKPSMCSFGGPGLDTLFVTSIQPATPKGDDVELAGEVFALRPGTQGLAETPYRPAPTPPPFPDTTQDDNRRQP